MFNPRMGNFRMPFGMPMMPMMNPMMMNQMMRPPHFNQMPPMRPNQFPPNMAQMNRPIMP